MCKGDTKSVEPVKSRSLFLFSVESFSGSEIPSNASQFSTGAVIILFLIGIEMSLRLFFTSIKVRKRSSVLVHLYMYTFVIPSNSSTQQYNSHSYSHSRLYLLCFNFFISQDAHPILDDATNRNILSRHIGVDAFSCFVVAILGWNARHVVNDMVDATLRRRKNAMPVAFEGRMFTYQPEAQRIALFFVAYQLKNTYDTIAWNDGIIFIIHHILTLFTTVRFCFVFVCS